MSGSLIPGSASLAWLPLKISLTQGTVLAYKSACLSSQVMCVYCGSPQGCRGL